MHYVEYFETEKDIYIPYGDAPFTWDASLLKEFRHVRSAPDGENDDPNGKSYMSTDV